MSLTLFTKIRFSHKFTNLQYFLTYCKDWTGPCDLIVDVLFQKGHSELRATCENLYKRFPDSLSAMMYWVLCQLDDFMGEFVNS